MKVVVDSALCEGNGVCESIAPDMFKVSEVGQAIVMAADGTQIDRERAARAVRYCPKGALRLEDEVVMRTNKMERGSHEPRRDRSE